MVKVAPKLEADEAFRAQVFESLMARFWSEPETPFKNPHASCFRVATLKRPKTPLKRPECGCRLVKLKSIGRFECRNEKCPVIEVRVSEKKRTQVLRDSILGSRAVKER